jgi:hypothetical protein
LVETVFHHLTIAAAASDDKVARLSCIYSNAPSTQWQCSKSSENVCFFVSLDLLTLRIKGVYRSGWPLIDIVPLMAIATMPFIS